MHATTLTALAHDNCPSEVKTLTVLLESLSKIEVYLKQCYNRISVSFDSFFNKESTAHCRNRWNYLHECIHIYSFGSSHLSAWHLSLELLSQRKLYIKQCNNKTSVYLIPLKWPICSDNDSEAQAMLKLKRRYAPNHLHLRFCFWTLVRQKYLTWIVASNKRLSP